MLIRAVSIKFLPKALRLLPEVSGWTTLAGPRKLPRFLFFRFFESLLWKLILLLQCLLPSDPDSLGLRAESVSRL